ncbi:non-ribosomal peptide synthetase [Bacillus thuringiensis]|uniref:non-ribosomal peptide synthetase n=1 Tax=Bacillus thuringiensis TaxID=1428 RepID=UPI000BF69250|nr:non-ribosomal peptide synthetase [Bacillus thuringiensis]PEY73227.1 non-ribosomal peptide synthetase [Bacillus thuringiensis]
MRTIENINSLLELLEFRSFCSPTKVAYTFWTDDGKEESITYLELSQKARKIGSYLQRCGATGERALLLFRPGLDYIAAFWGCLYGGVTAVPAYPPRQNGHLGRLELIVQDADARFALTSIELLNRIASQEYLVDIEWIAVDQINQNFEEEWRAPAINGKSLAFLQYTSGSTSAPKGVMLTHENLLDNVRLIQQGFQTTSESKGALWLPPYHDMGLIGGIIQPVYTGYSMNLLSPVSFIQSPYRWLEMISQKKITVSGGPNFAYELCTQKITPEQCEQLDLSSWELAFSGAEPVRYETIERFVKMFAPYGFREEAFYSCYGLAEATLFVTGTKPHEGIAVRQLNSKLLQENKVMDATDDLLGSTTLVSSGQLKDDTQEILIVNPDTLNVYGDDEIGEIWIRGRSVAQGYWKREEQTIETFNARPSGTCETSPSYLRTGDLGFVKRGELFVTGRLKDLIIIRGRNYYPQDLEGAIQMSHPAIRNSNGAAFTVEIEGKEELIVVQEIERTFRKSNLEEVIKTIRKEIAKLFELRVHTVVLIRPASIPKTSSGKVQRQECKKRFLQGELKVIKVDAHLGGDSKNILTTPVESKSFNIKKGTLSKMDQEELQTILLNWLRYQLSILLKDSYEEISMEQSLYELGMDSLGLMELASQIRKDLDVEIDFEVLAENICLAQIVEVLVNKLLQCREQIAVNDKDIPIEFPINLSYGQQSQMYFHSMDVDSGAYVVTHTFKLKDDIDLIALRATFQSILHKHESLRTVYEMQDSIPVQRVLENQEVFFIVTEWHGNTKELQRCIQEEAYRPFDLTHGPLLRVRIYCTRDNIWMNISIHHIACDFHSLEILLSDIATFYELHVNKKTVELELPTSYLPFVHRQKEMLNGTEGEKCWNYWKETLSGEISPLLLPTDHTRPHIQTFQGATLPFIVPKRLVMKLRNLARKQKVTLYSLLLATYELFLYRLSNQNNFLIGTTLRGRRSLTDKEVVGYFVNTLPVRALLTNDMSFENIIQKVQGNVKNLLKYQDYPFALLVSRLQMKYDASHPPLYQVMFNFLKSHEESITRVAMRQEGVTLKIGNTEWVNESMEHPYSQVDLSLNLGEVNDGLVGFFEYNTDLFEKQTIERFIQRFTLLLEQIVVDPQKDIDSYKIIPEQEEQILLKKWNNTITSYDRKSTIISYFERQVERTPDAIAVVYENERVTYGELNQRANRLAHALQNAGIHQGSKVGIYLLRSIEMVVAVLGVLKTGAAYIPLDSKYPIERTSYTVEDAQVSLVITEEAIQSQLLPHFKGEIFCLESECVKIQQQSSQNLDVAIGTSDVAYVIYTSGSTGKPKGVVLEHRSVSALVNWAKRVYSVEELSGVLFGTSLCFDLSVFELFVTLSVGGKVIVAENALYLTELLAKNEVTLINTVPSAIDAILQMDSIPRSVQTVNLAGEPLKAHIVKRLYDLGHVKRVYNLYGPTEDTTYSTASLVGYREEPNIGRPIDNTRIYLLDDKRRMVPIGLPGELYIGGEGLAREYFNNPHMTQDKFIQDPFSKNPKDCLYRTGDLARYQANGNLEYLGRMDHQIKIRGFRVELGEIETRLLELQGVREVVVVAQEDEKREKMLVVYWSSVDDQVLTEYQLRSYLQSVLPEYMVPSHYIKIESIPLMPNGKVDRKSLPKVPIRKIGKKEIETTSSAEEELILEIWKELLDCSNISVHDSFFDHGGNSLLLMRLLSILRGRFDVNCELRTLFSSDTIAAQAKLITGLNDVKKEDLNLLTHFDRSCLLPLSFTQKRMWFLQQLDPDSGVYNMPAAVKLTGNCNIGALEDALTYLVTRHEAFQTSFNNANKEGEPFISISNQTAFQVNHVDAREWPIEKRDELLAGWMRKESLKPFNLQVAPLLRVSLIAINENEHILFVVMHHIISDGWSLGIFIRELSDIYKTFVNEKTPQLPNLPIQYVEAVYWQEQRLEKIMPQQLKYWKKQLSGQLPLLSLPTNRPRPSIQTYSGGEVRFKLGKELTIALKALGKKRKKTLYTILLSAYTILLHRYSAQEDILVGSPVANRSRSDIEGVIGCFVNTLAMRIKLSGQNTFNQVMSLVQETTIEAFENQDIPFEKIIAELQPKRNMSYSPLFQTMFVLQNTPISDLELEGLNVRYIPIESGTAKYDLTLYFEEQANQLNGKLEYNSDLFDHVTVERIVKHLIMILEGIVKKPDIPIRHLPILTVEEEQMVQNQQQSLIQLQTLERIGRWERHLGKVISLVEIERVLEQDNRVKEALIIKEKQDEKFQLNGYIVVNLEKQLTAEELKNSLQATIPESMRLDQLFIVDKLPSQSINEDSFTFVKADRHISYVEAQNSRQEELIKLWADVLNISPDEIGVNDNFFDMGGHSLLATKIGTRIHMKYGILLPLRTFFEAVTVAELDEVIRLQEEKLQVTNSGTESQMIRAVPREAFRIKRSKK